MHAFALERLREGAEEERLRERHAEHCGAVAMTAAAALAGPDQAAALDRLAREHENLSAACATLAAAGRSGDLARTAHGLWRYWSIRGHLREGLEWSERALSDHGLRAEEAVRLDRAVLLARDGGDDPLLAQALVIRAHVGLLHGHLDVARAAVTEAVARCAGRGDRVETALAGRCAASLAAAAGDLALADRRLAESEAVLRDSGSPWDLALTLALRARVHWSAGDLERGREAAREAVEILAALGDTWPENTAIFAVARRPRRGHRDWTMVQCLSGLADAAERLGRPDRAALFRGAGDALRERSGAAVLAAAEPADPARPAWLTALWERGRHFTLDEVVSLVAESDR